MSDDQQARPRPWDDAEPAPVTSPLGPSVQRLWCAGRLSEDGLAVAVTGTPGRRPMVTAGEAVTIRASCPTVGAP